jgi:cysteinyl-tRNA synthetase
MKLYNTLSKQVEELKPMKPGKVNLFVCGPTVFDSSHIGHAKTYTQFDILARTLRYFGLEVNYLQNITDIDDKIIARAREKNIEWNQLVEQYEAKYKEDMAILGNDSVNTYARATDYIEDIKRQVKALMDKGHAYLIEGDGIYFEITTFKDYGKLSGRTEVGQDDARSRIDDSDNKRGWNDFCLWKFSKEGEPKWPAEFGHGRPGWHIEDTAITEHHFGQQYDMHGGAIDLIFPHHEAELTQMEAISGKSPFVKYWVHTGFLNIAKAKMSKSQGNFLTIKEVASQIGDPQALRMMFLQSHYRSTMEFDQEILKQAKTRLDRLRNLAELRWQAAQYDSEDEIELLVRAKREFEDALADDMSTPKALSLVSQVQDGLDGGLSLASLSSFTDFLNTIDSTTGLRLIDSTPDIENSLKTLIELREEARQSQDFAEADKLRDKLSSQGLELKDTPHGAIWQRLSS